jgi:hypothetical protein
MSVYSEARARDRYKIRREMIATVEAGLRDFSPSLRKRIASRMVDEALRKEAKRNAYIERSRTQGNPV